MSHDDDTGEKASARTHSNETEPTQAAPPINHDVRLARIERKQTYTHALLALTIATVGVAAATLTGSAVWAAVGLAALAATAGFASAWKTTGGTSHQ